MKIGELDVVVEQNNMVRGGGLPTCDTHRNPSGAQADGRVETCAHLPSRGFCAGGGQAKGWLQ